MGYRKATDFYIALGQGKLSTKTVANKLMQRLKQGEAVDEDPTSLPPGRARRGPRPPHQGRLQLRDRGQGRRQRRSAARQVLPAGAGRRDRRLRLASGAGSPSTAPTASNVKALKRAPERFVEVSWEGGNESSYRVELQIDAYDRTRLLEDLSRTFSEAGINIIGATCTTNHPMVQQPLRRRGGGHRAAQALHLPPAQASSRSSTHIA